MCIKDLCIPTVSLSFLQIAASQLTHPSPFHQTHLPLFTLLLLPPLLPMTTRGWSGTPQLISGALSPVMMPTHHISVPPQVGGQMFIKVYIVSLHLLLYVHTSSAAFPTSQETLILTVCSKLNLIYHVLFGWLCPQSVWLIIVNSTDSADGWIPRKEEMVWLHTCHVSPQTCQHQLYFQSTIKVWKLQPSSKLVYTSTLVCTCWNIFYQLKSVCCFMYSRGL